MPLNLRPGFKVHVPETYSRGIRARSDTWNSLFVYIYICVCVAVLISKGLPNPTVAAFVMVVFCVV